MIDIQKVSLDEIEILWHCHFYDGPINGVCTWKDQDYWFELLSDVADDAPWAYNIIDIGVDNMMKEWSQHAAFRYLVGHHTDHQNKGQVKRTTDIWSKFYDRFKDDHNYDDYPVVGRFSR